MLNNILKNKSKSNRAQADYFELLVGQYICYLYKITFSYSKDLAKLSNKVLKLPNGKERLKLQNDNIIKIESEIKKILDYEIKNKGKIIKVIWTGRELRIESTSDIDAKHISNKKTKFSIKSISSSGTGTLKNLGLSKLEEILDFDFSKQNKKMWNELGNFLKIPKANKRELKRKARSKKNLLNWASENGKKYQRKLNEICFRKFNELSKEKKISFLNFISDNQDEDLYVIIANSSGVVIYKPVDRKINLIDKIEAKKQKGQYLGYIIFINNIPTYRVQTNNTNGIGISPFCQRIFLI